MEYLSFSLRWTWILATAALIASSANIEQCNLTSGHVCSKAMSRFVIKTASFNVFPFTHSLATDEEAVRVTKEAARQLSLRGSSFHVWRMSWF